MPPVFGFGDGAASSLNGFSSNSLIAPSSFFATAPRHFGGKSYGGVRPVMGSSQTAVASAAGDVPTITSTVAAGTLIILMVESATSSTTPPTHNFNGSFPGQMLASVTSFDDGVGSPFGAKRLSIFTYVKATGGSEVLDPVTNATGVLGLNNSTILAMNWNVGTFDSSITNANAASKINFAYRTRGRWVPANGDTELLLWPTPVATGGLHAKTLVGYSNTFQSGGVSYYDVDSPNEYLTNYLTGVTGQSTYNYLFSVDGRFGYFDRTNAYRSYFAPQGQATALILYSLSIPPYYAAPPAKYDLFVEKDPKPYYSPAELRSFSFTTTNSTSVTVDVQTGDHVYLFVTSTHTSATPPVHSANAGFTLLGSTTVVDGTESARTSVAKYIASSSGTPSLTPFGVTGTGGPVTRIGVWSVVGASAGATPTLAMATTSGGGDPNPPAVATSDGALILLYGFVYDGSGSSGFVEPPWGTVDDFDWLTANRGVMGAHTVARGITSYDSGPFDPNGSTNYTFGAALSIPSAYVPAAAQTGNHLERTTAGPDWGSSGAFGTYAFAGDCAVRFQVTSVHASGSLTRNAMIGFSVNDPDQSYASIDVAAYLAEDYATIYENMVWAGVNAPIGVGDYFELKRVGTTWSLGRLSWNDQVAGITSFTTVVNALNSLGGTVYLDAAFYNPSKFVNIVAIDGGTPVAPLQWTNVHDVVVSTKYQVFTVPGSYSLSGSAVSMRIARTLAPVAGSYALTGSPITLRAARKIVPTAGSYAVTGSPVNLRVDRRLVPTAGAYAVTGSSIVLRAARKLLVSGGSYALTGSSVVLRAARRIALTSGSYALTGSAVSMLLMRRLSPTAGSYSLTGASVLLRAARRLAASAGSYALTGSSIGLRADRRLVPTAGSYLLSSSGVVLAAARRLGLTAGAYALTGSPVGLRRGYILSPQGGAYALSGGSVALRVARVLVAQAGSYALAGQSIALRRALALIAQPGAYSLTGSPLELRRGYELVLAPGSYALTGSPLGLSAARRLALQAGAYALAGSSVAMRRALAMQLEAGSYELEGFEVVLNSGRDFTLLPGSYSIVGGDLELRASRRMQVQPGSYVLAGSSVLLTYSGAAKTIAVNPGAYSVSGFSIGLRASRRLAPGVGSYELVGSPIRLASTRVILLGSGGYDLTGFPIEWEVFTNAAAETNQGSAQVRPHKGHAGVRPHRGSVRSRGG